MYSRLQGTQLKNQNVIVFRFPDLCCFLFFAPYGLKKVRFTCYRALSAPAQSPIEGSHHRHRPATGSMMSRGNINASTAPAHKTTACKVVSKTRKIGKKRRKSHFFVYFAKKQTLNSKSRSVGAKAVQLQLVESLIVLVVTLARFHRSEKRVVVTAFHANEFVLRSISRIQHTAALERTLH